jgi:hypothetical protein
VCQRAPIDGLIGALFQACGDQNYAQLSSPTAIASCCSSPVGTIVPISKNVDAAPKIQSTFESVQSPSPFNGGVPSTTSFLSFPLEAFRGEPGAADFRKRASG